MGTTRPVRVDAAPGGGAAGPEREPRAGDILEITREASVQFVTPIRFRVIRVLNWPTYAGWMWLDGYQLNEKGEAVDRRSIFVQSDGLRWVPVPPPRGNRK